MSSDTLENATIPTSIKKDIHLNRQELIKEGIEWIQDAGHEKWTNYNTSDPGRMILDLMCYSLLDLGYKSEFSIQDILADKTNKIDIKNQLYNAREVLFANPLTTKDFQKLIIDKAEGIKNAWVASIEVQGGIKGLMLPSYEISDDLKIAFLKRKSGQLSPASKKALSKDLLLIQSGINATFYKYRNLGELFLVAEMLKPISYLLSGDFHLSSAIEVEKGLARMLFELNNQVSSYVKFSTYEELKGDGLEVDEIMIGPKLDNGFIKDDYLRPQLRKIDKEIFQSKLQNTNGIESISSFNIHEEGKRVESKRVIDIPFGSVPFFDYSQIVKIISENNDFSLYHGNEQIVRIDQEKVNACYVKLSKRQPVGNYEFKDHLGPQIPEADFRNIKSYHSIQNLFPQQFGLDVTHSYEGIPKEKRGPAKQLKGYVMLFEQLIADYQAQLANLPSLLSFDSGVKAGDELCKTHYTQGLYKTPGSRFILKAFESYNRTNKYLEEHPDRTWEKFKEDENNSYETFLRTHSNILNENIESKSNTLTHLLARFGEKYDKIPALNLNPSYGNYSLARVEVTSSLLKKLDVFSGNMGRSYFHSLERKDMEDVFVSGLEVHLYLLFQLNDYYEGVEELLENFRNGKKMSHLKMKVSSEEEERVKIWYHNELIVDLPFVNGDLNSTIDVHVKQLRKIRQQTVGLVMIDNQLILSHIQGKDWSILCEGKPKKMKGNSSEIIEEFLLKIAHSILKKIHAFRKINPLKESCELEIGLNNVAHGITNKKHIPISSDPAFQGNVSIFFPDWLCKLKDPKFLRLFRKHVEEEGPAHLRYDIFHLSISDMDYLLSLKKIWLKGLRRLQQGRKFGLVPSFVNQLLLQFFLKQKSNSE